MALSLLLHVLPMLAVVDFVPFPPSTATPLTAELRPPPPGPAVPPLRLPEPPEPATSTERPRRPAKAAAQQAAPRAAKPWTEAVRDHLNTLDARGRLYPADAIAQGLQGEALVLLVIDERGQVVATRLEHSSGHAILDEAALRAVRSLQSLPADAPQQALLPVRFRLR